MSSLGSPPTNQISNHFPHSACRPNRSSLDPELLLCFLPRRLKPTSSSSIPNGSCSCSRPRAGALGLVPSRRRRQQPEPPGQPLAIVSFCSLFPASLSLPNLLISLYLNRSSSTMVIPSSARAARRLQAPSFQQSRRMPLCPCCIPRTHRRPRPSGYHDAPDASSTALWTPTPPHRAAAGDQQHRSLSSSSSPVSASPSPASCLAPTASLAPQASSRVNRVCCHGRPHRAVAASGSTAQVHQGLSHGVPSSMRCPAGPLLQPELLSLACQVRRRRSPASPLPACDLCFDPAPVSS
ncbi:uncharacterized protein [Triticum aestivum]|uniref:uncharacterized protein isoform X1 n=1 Tax=Triticum aestivum TaxID=4565 RepID=UPI001D02CC8C|nr:uncharacterized protein LOC123112483 isoform X1 [Triticum aestivum]